MHRRFPTMAVLSAATLLGCLLLGPVASLAAIATIDVGAAATIGNEWRPTSCDAVKGGVVLTNMVANVRAIIDGCTIALTSEPDSRNAAVKVASFGAGSSLELRNCAISASFTANSQASAISIGTVRTGTSIVLSNTTVTASSRSIVGLYLALGSAGSAVNVTVDRSAFDIDGVVDNSAISTGNRGSNFGSGSVFNFIDSTAAVRGKLIFAVRIRALFRDNAAISILRSNFTTTEVGGNKNHGIQMEAALGDNCSFLLSHSIVTATGFIVTAVSFTNPVSYGKNLSVAIVATTITGTSANSAVVGVALDQQTIGEQFALSVAESTITTSTNGASNALSFANSQIGPNASIQITDSTFNASGSGSHVTIIDSTTFSGRPAIAFLRSSIIGRSSGVGYAPAFSALANTWSSEGLALTLESSKLYSSAALGSIVLLAGTFPALDIKVVSSVLEVVATANADPPAGVIAFATTSVWNGGSLSVSDSTLALLDGTAAAAKARFVQWPGTMSGAVPQTFDSVTLSAPAGLLSAAFAASAGGKYSANTTFCANNVKWANGTAVVSGPPEFAAVTTCHVSLTVAPSASVSTTASPKPTTTASLTLPPSPTLTAPRTASAAASKTASAPATQSSVPTASQPVTASRRLTPSKPRSKTVTVAPTKTIPRTLTPLTPAPATPVTPVPASPAPAASSATSASFTPAPATPAPVVRSSGESSAATPAPVTPAPVTAAPVVQPAASSAFSSASSAASSSASSPGLTPAPAVSPRRSSSRSSHSGSATPAPAAGPAPSSHGSSPVSSAATPAPRTAAPGTPGPAAPGSSSEDSGAGPATPAPPGPAPSPAAGVSAAVLLAATALMFASV